MPIYVQVGFNQQENSLPWLPKQLQYHIIKSQMLDGVYNKLRGS
jgi:hypothetical protein